MAAPFALTEINRVKTALGVTGQSEDGHLLALIDTVSGQIATAMNRSDLVLRTSRTEDHDVEPDQRWFRLRASPLVSVTSVSYDPLQGFGSGTLLAAENYVLKLRTGQLYVRYDLIVSHERPEPQSLRVVYTGGMATNLEALRASEFADLEEAVGHQILAVWKRKRTTPERTSISGQGGSVNFPTLELVPAAAAIVARYRRKSVR